MADTWEVAARLRPLARPDGIEPEAVRPQLRPDGLGSVSEETLVAATVTGALPLDETALIGLFSGPDGGTALLRLPDGGVVKVAAGGYVAGGRVTAISEDGVRLQRGGQEIVLTMPG